MHQCFAGHLHLVDGDSAAGLLAQALGVTRQQLIVNRDPVHCGPAPGTDDWRVWGKVRAGYLESLDGDPWPREYFEFAERDFNHSLQKAAESPPFYLWLGPSVGDQLLLARLLTLLKNKRLSADVLCLMQYERVPNGRVIRGLGELSPAQIRQLAPEPRFLTKEEIATHLRAWRSYTSSTPFPLKAFLDSPRSTSLLYRAMRSLVGRYPDAHSGLSRFQSELLKACHRCGPRATRVIGEVLGCNDTLDCVGDSYLFQLLLGLGSAHLREPLLSISGDQSLMRDCAVELTSFGELVLTGKANAASVNGRAGWVGGVDLSSTAAVNSDGVLVVG